MGMKCKNCEQELEKVKPHFRISNGHKQKLDYHRHFPHSKPFCINKEVVELPTET